MCGVAFIHRRGARKSELREAITRMNDVQRRRGPDAQRYVVGDDCAIGHTRLRVLDLDVRADQPFGGASGLLSYNGEIYNYRTVRQELERLGAHFATTSDTEVVYHALRLWDLDALERLHGMYAFVWWRPDRRELYLARDRLGIKPLHLWCRGQTLTVASEAKAIAALGASELDREALFQILRFNHPLGRKSALRDVEALEPGTAARFDLDTLSCTRLRYWRPQLGGRAAARFGERASELDRRFRNAIRSHLAADVPVACYMSSGIDSCGIAFQAKAEIGRRLTAYSMVFPGAAFSEQSAIDDIVRELDVPHESFPIDAVTLDDLVDFVWSAEMPQWWTSDLALKKLAAHVARSGTKVVLSGEGPDEFLAGYDAYRVMKLRRWAQRLGLAPLVNVAALRRRALSAVLPWLDIDVSTASFYLERHARSRRAELAHGYGFYPENIATWDALSVGRHDILTAGAREGLAGALEGERDWFRRHIGPEVRDASVLEANLYFEIAVRLPRWVLHMGDRMSAAHGLELRFPYLDDNVVDLLLALPESDRLHGLTEKYILKRVHAARLPRAVVDKRKQALYTPIAEWLEPSVADPRLESYWSCDAFERTGMFDFDACQPLLARVRARRFADELDKMQCEWALMMVLSTNVLAKLMEDGGVCS